MPAYPDDIASADLSAATATDVISPSSPQDTGYTFSAIINNRNASTSTDFTLSISGTSVTHANAGKIMDAETIPGGGRVVISGLAMGGDKYLVATSTQANVNVLVVGITV